jgi:hypothetical protein
MIQFIKKQTVNTVNLERNKNMANTKRGYTARNTTVVGVRTVLLNGEVVGKGRPSKEGKNQRMVVYVPKGQTYNVAVHGLGVKFNPLTHKAIRRLKSANVVVDLATAPVVVEAVSDAPVATEPVGGSAVPSTPVPVETVAVTQGSELIPA